MIRISKSQWLAMGRKVIQTVLHPLAHTRMFFIFSLLMVYVIMIVGNNVGAPTDPFLSFLLPIFDVYLFCCLAALLRKIKLHWIVMIAVVVVLFAELFTELFYHSNFTIYVVLLLFETNPQESSEFLEATLTQQSTWIAVALTIVVAVVAWLLTRVSRKSFRYKGILAFIVFGLVVWSGIRQLSAYYKLYCCFTCASTTVCNDPQYCPHLNTPFVRLAYGVAYNIASSAELEVLAETVANTQVDNCDYRCKLIVLVIGESYNKHHSPLYGYNLSTTPRLEKLRDEGHLWVYTDAVTPYNFTSNAFKYMFSTWDNDDEEEWTRHTLFPAVFRKAGYNVYFITNQFVMEQTNSWDLAGGTIFNHHGLSDLQFTKRNHQVYTYDGDMLKEIPPLDSLTAQPTLLIVHLEGQHVKYAYKYPAEFSRFKATDEQTPFGGEQGKEIAAHYDNATYYNDFIVDSIFKMVSGTDAIGIYLSDHGEEAYDWRDKFERTNEHILYPEVARFQYEIPLMFYATDTFAVHHPEIVDAIKTAVDKPFLSSDLPHVLFYLGGISCKDYKEKRNILSPRYDTHRKRFIRTDVDYDELMKGK